MKRHLASRFLRLCLSATGLLGASLLGAGQAYAGEPVPTLEITKDLPPPKARVQTLLLGTAVFGGFYGGAVAASYGWSQDPGAADLRIPLVGPWLKLGQTELCSGLPEPGEDERPCSDPLQVAGGVLAVISGIGQIGGLALLLEGTFMRTRAPSANASTWQPGSQRLRLFPAAPDFRRAHAPALSFVPVLTPSTVGAVVSGTF